MIDFKLVENYRDDENLRNKFNRFTEIVFSGLNFERWYKSGYWTPNYIPHSLIRNNKIIANVSISKMEIILNRKRIRGIQFGTVGTIPEYRKKGLSKYLMEYVLNKYENYTDIFFLFANDTVLDFYPKFGLQRKMESIYILNSTIPKTEYSARKLNIKNKKDFALIKEMLDKRLLLTSIFAAMNYSFISMWHLIYGFSDDIYFLEDENIIFILNYKKNKLHIWDIICAKPFDLSPILPKVIPQENINSIVFYFPPDELGFKYDEIVPDQKTMLFVKGKFPLKGKPFKFPTTAQT